MSSSTAFVFAGTMLRCDPAGDIDPNGFDVPGLFVNDVRVLSRLVLTVNGNACSATSTDSAVGRRTVVLVPAHARHQTSAIVLTRTQSLDSAGLAEHIDVHNVTSSPTSPTIAVELSFDFADPFLLRTDGRTFDRSAGIYRIQRNETRDSVGLTAHYERERSGRRFTADVEVAASGLPQIDTIGLDPDGIPRARLQWQIELAAGEKRALSLSVKSGMPRAVPTLDASPEVAANRDLAALRRQAIEDISALRMPCPPNAEFSDRLSDLNIVAAGAPWFLTLFGRDSILTSLLAEADLPGIGDNNLRALVATQAKVADPGRAADPGKILHELRNSELARLGEVPYRAYYGSVDSTPLFLTALATIGSTELQHESESAARAAIGWMRGLGGLTETGFLRYVSDPNGLITQGWKDSADSVAHANGRIAGGAIALAEVQGYAWRAFMDTARLARDVWADAPWASELETVADELRTRFRERFWMPGREFPAIALDGADLRVEVVASNAGHLLYSGMLTFGEAEQVAARLLDADMFTGWGIRTLSSSEVRFNPLSYHNGAVWPHDTMLAGVGMAAYGMRNEARIVASAIVEAAAQFDNRPPELFGGFDREQYPHPITYSEAAVPQAWASAAMLAAVRVLEDAVPTRKDSE